MRNMFVNKYFFKFCVCVFIINTHCSHLSWKGDHSLKKSPRIGFIIGPGGALSLSAIGVLKTLQENNISVDFVLGMGWGAWSAAVFSKNKSTDEIQWSFHKLLKRGFFSSSLLKHPLKQKNISEIEKELEENFGSFDLVKISFSCPSFTQYGVKVWQTEKFLKSSVKKCLAVPPFFKYTLGAPFSMRAAIAYLQHKKMDIIIWVNPLQGQLFSENFPQNGIRLLWIEMSESFRLIPEEPGIFKVTPDLTDFYLGDFSKIDDLILRGRSAGDILVKKLQNKI